MLLFLLCTAAIEENLLWAVDNMNTLSDYPWSNFLPEILALVPDVKVLQTLRDPVDWARRRLQHHNPKICHVDLHRSEKTRHPFDIIGCLGNLYTHIASFIFPSLA